MKRLSLIALFCLSGCAANYQAIRACQEQYPMPASYIALSGFGVLGALAMQSVPEIQKVKDERLACVQQAGK